jgi:hypothetical protein
MAVQCEVELMSGPGGDGSGTWQTVYESTDIFELTDLEIHPQVPLAGWFRIVAGVDMPGKAEPEPITGVYLVQGGTFAWTPLSNVKTKRLAARVDTGPPGQGVRLRFRLGGRSLKE